MRAMGLGQVGASRTDKGMHSFGTMGCQNARVWCPRTVEVEVHVGAWGCAQGRASRTDRGVHSLGTFGGPFA